MSQVNVHYLEAPYPANRERRSHKQLTLVRHALPYNDMNQRTVLVSTFFVLISSVYISSFSQREQPFGEKNCLLVSQTKKHTRKYGRRHQSLS